MSQTAYRTHHAVEVNETLAGRQFLAPNNIPANLLDFCLNITRKIMSIETNEYIGIRT